MNRNDETTQQLADALIVGTASFPASLSPDDRLELAWALKEAGAAAWNGEPQKTVAAANVLNRLCTIDTSLTRNASQLELAAVCTWVNGFADLTNSAMTKAIQHFDAAAAQFSALNQTANSNHTQIPKVIALCILGEFARAQECGSQTLAKLMQDGDLHAACRLSINLGNVSLEISNYDAALDFFENGVAIATSLSDFERQAVCLTGAANVHKMLGNFPEAIEKYQRAAVIAAEHKFSFTQAVITESIALVQLTRGEYTAALKGLEQARTQFVALDVPQSYAITEKLLADSYLDLHLVPEARALFEQAIARFESLEMYFEKGSALAQLGRTLALSSSTRNQAIARFEQAEALFVKQEVPVGLASVKLARAELALVELNYSLAIKGANEAAAIFAQRNLRANELAANIVASFATLESGAVHDAASQLVTLNEEAKKLGLRSLEVRCLIGIGIAEQKRGNEAQAKGAFTSAIEAFEEQRSALPGDDIRSAFLVDHARPYVEMLRMALAAHDREPDEQTARMAIYWVEQLRARTLNERLGETRIRGRTENEDEETTQLRQRLNGLNRRAQQLIDEGEESNAVTDEAHRIERELLENARRNRIAMESDGRGSRRNVSDERNRDFVALQGMLGPEDALIEFGMLDDELFVCVVTSDQLSIRRRLAHWPDVLEAIEVVQFQIDTLRIGASHAAQHQTRLVQRAQAASKSLYNLLWAPLSSAVASKQCVLVAPHAQLGNVQFAALFDGKRYLAEDKQIAIVPSAQSACHGLTRLPNAPERLLVMGDTLHLAHAREEALFVAKLFDNPTVLVDESGTVENLRRDCEGVDVLHLACHAKFRSDNPMFSALELADQSLAVIDAETLQLNSALVSLSACETGISQHERGDEMFGLVRAFLMAGASRIVASLWAVDDELTVRFMGSFYTALKRGNTPASALRSAQLDVMKTHPHPFYWAAFVLYGGW